MDIFLGIMKILVNILVTIFVATVITNNNNDKQNFKLLFIDVIDKIISSIDKVEKDINEDNVSKIYSLCKGKEIENYFNILKNNSSSICINERDIKHLLECKDSFREKILDIIVVYDTDFQKYDEKFILELNSEVVKITQELLKLKFQAYK